MTELPGHHVDQLIRELPGARRVLRTRFRGVACVTRVLLGARVDPELGPQIARAALHGRGSLAGIPEEVLLTLEGYVVAARLPQPDPRWPQALGAGVTAEGHVWVTTRWMEGTPLHQVTGPLPLEARRGVALGVLDILSQLHAHHVAHGDLKPENVVLGPDGELAIIDLDTLREVAGDQAWAVTRDITRSWAAPEQEQQRRTFLSSDLWGWARLVRTLFPEGAPPVWLPALRACQLGDPLRRPHTMRLLSALHDPREPLLDWLDRPTPPEGLEPAPLGGGASISTERVPEASAVGTERVGEATAPRTVPTAALPRRRRVPSCVVIALAFVVSPITLCAGGALWWDHRNVQEANRLAEGAMAALKAHKVNPALNQKSQRAPLLAMAEEAWRTRRTPRSSAVRALALVWAQGWQDSGKKWDADAFAEAREAIEKVEDSRQPEALLAFGSLYAAACRLNRADATAQASCQRALEALEGFQDRLPEGAEHHWLRVEGAWTEVLVRGDLAMRLESSGSPEAQALLDAAVARCDEADPWLAWAPVNGPELLQDCLRMDGLAGRMDRYLHHADLLVAADRQDGTLEKSTVWHLYAAAGTGCDSVTVEKRRGGDWSVRGAEWCLAAGHAARGCYGDALGVALAGSIYDPDRPWEALWKAIPQGAGTERCVR